MDYRWRFADTRLILRGLTRTTMRILLFLATNAAILVVISVVFQIFGFEGILQENGVDLDLKALLLLSAVIGFGGSFISLAMSKWMAERAMGVRIIEQPANQTEQWLVETVRRQSQAAGIGMPEVGISTPRNPTPSPPAPARTLAERIAALEADR
jgi:heat shock protein HtpX